MSVLQNNELIVQNTGDVTDEMYVAFCDSNTKWVTKLFGKDLGHCFVILKLKNGVWVGLDPRPKGMFVCTVPDMCPSYPEWLKQKHGNKILKMKIATTDNEFGYLPGLSVKSCVSFVKYVIGIKAPWCLSPKSLYCLLRNKYEAEEL